MKHLKGLDQCVRWKKILVGGRYSGAEPGRTDTVSYSIRYTWGYAYRERELSTTNDKNVNYSTNYSKPGPIKDCY